MGGTHYPVCRSCIGSRALSTRPLGKLPCLLQDIESANEFALFTWGISSIYIGELLFKSGLEFGKEFRIFGLAFKKV